MQPTYNDCIFLHKRQVVADAHFALAGDNPDSIINTNSEYILKEGKDYTVSDGSLIFKANFLLTLPSYPLGEVAVLCCNFSGGSSREIRVFQLDVDVKATDSKSDEPLLNPDTKRKALQVAIGGVGLLAAAAVVKAIISRNKKI